MATPTLANPPKPHLLFPEIVRPFGPLSYPKPRPKFRVFPTGEAKYHWRIVSLATNQTVSRHKSLTNAIRKCTRLNVGRSEGVRNESN